jgi:hypothetical protein
LEFDDKASLTFVLGDSNELKLLNPDRRTTFVQKNNRSSYTTKPLTMGDSKNSQKNKNLVSDDNQLLLPARDDSDDGSVKSKKGDQGVQP